MEAEFAVFCDYCLWDCLSDYEELPSGAGWEDCGYVVADFSLELAGFASEGDTDY